MKLNDNQVKVGRYFKYKFNFLDSITPSCGQWACSYIHPYWALSLPSSSCQITYTGRWAFMPEMWSTLPSCPRYTQIRYSALASQKPELEQIIHENWAWQALVSGDCSALWISTLYKYHMISSTLLLFCFCWPIDTESNKWFRSLHIISDQLWGVYDYNYCWMLGNWWLSPLKALNNQNSSQNQKKILRKAQIHQDGHTKGCYDC